jgi:hypothetical protein
LATDARVHCAVLKQRPATHHPTLTGEFTGAGNRRTDSNEPVPSDTQQRARHSQPIHAFHAEAVLTKTSQPCRIVNVPPMSNQHRTFAGVLASDQASLVRSAP